MKMCISIWAQVLLFVRMHVFVADWLNAQLSPAEETVRSRRGLGRRLESAAGSEPPRNAVENLGKPLGALPLHVPVHDLVELGEKLRAGLAGGDRISLIALALEKIRGGHRAANRLHHLETMGGSGEIHKLKLRAG